MAGRSFAELNPLPVADIEPVSERSKHVLIDQLNAVVAKLEGRSARMDAPVATDAKALDNSNIIRVGIDAVDKALGGGLATNALHEIRAETALDLPCAAGFALALGMRMVRATAPIFWIVEKPARLEGGEFYGPGMSALGFEPSRLVHVFASDCAQALWAAGEVAACPSAGLCLLELRGNPALADLALSRRLALRAAQSGVPVILLRQSGRAEASAARTRWQISPAPSWSGAAAQPWVGPAAWWVVLEKCRGGQPGRWKLEWRHDECLFAPCPDAASPFSPVAGTPFPGDQPAHDRDRPDRAASLGSGLAHKRAS